MVYINIIAAVRQDESTESAGLFSFKQIVGLSQFLDFPFQSRCGYKPHLPGLGCQN